MSDRNQSRIYLLCLVVVIMAHQIADYRRESTDRDRTKAMVTEITDQVVSVLKENRKAFCDGKILK